MILRNLIFDPEIVEQRLRARVMSHHEQQASERGNEQQHHELWPAYNLTLVREQASSQVLFQQQRDVTTVESSGRYGRGRQQEQGRSGTLIYELLRSHLSNTYIPWTPI
jgi:hypothetical protein